MENPNEPLELVFNPEDMIQESLVIGELKKAGIDCVVQGFEDIAYDGLWTKKYGYSRIFVLQHQVEKAKEIINGVMLIP